MFNRWSANAGIVRASRRACSLPALLLAATALSASPANAVDPSAVRWVNPGSGNWLDPANWEVGSIPTSNDTPYVDNGGTAQVTGGDDALSRHVVIGTSLGSGGVKVSGSGSTLTVLSNIYLGVYGLGTLDISDGGKVSVGAAAYVGQNYDPATGGTGLVTVTGPGSVLSTGALDVGYYGKGTIEITDGGTVNSSRATLGHYGVSTSFVKVDGAGSRWNVTGDLLVGDEGTGTLNIRNGGLVTSSNAYIGSQMGGGGGTVVVDGAGSRWTNYGDMYLGMIAQDSTLTISNGATVYNEGGLDIGAGTLNIGAAANKTAVAAGTFYASGINFQGGTGALVFNHTNTDYRFDTVMWGDGTIRQMGPGTTVLTGDSSLFTGETFVDAGTLIVDVDGLLGGVTTVNAGGTLGGGRGSGGSGKVGTTYVMAGGTIAPGQNSIDTLKVDGTLGFLPGSIYEVDVNSTTSDLIHVTGTAYLNPARIVVNPEAGTRLLTRYTILTANVGLDGTFGSTPVESDLAFMAASLDYDANNVYLDFDRNSVAFADVAATGNQAGAAAAAEVLGKGSELYDLILSLSAEEAQAAFDALSGEGHATIKGVLVENIGLIREALLHRIRAGLNELDSSGAGSGYAAAPVLAEDGTRLSNLWGQFYGGLGNRDGDGNAAAAEFGAGGLVAGVDTSYGEWRLGLSAHAGTSDFAIDDRATEGTSTDLGLGLYAGTKWGDTGFSIAGSVTQHGISTTREVAIPGLTETLTADYGATTGQVVAELDHEFDFGAFGLTPFAQLGHTRHATEAFSEQGGTAALSSAADVVNQSFAALGLRGEYQFVVGDGGLATFSGGIGWRRGFGEAPTAQLGFLGGSPLEIAATPAAADSLLLEAGFDLDLGTGFDLSVSYAGEVAVNEQSHVVRAGIGRQF